MSDDPRTDRTTELLDAVLDAWERNNTALINLVGAIPPGGLEARAAPGSPTVAEMLTHLHHERRRLYCGYENRHLAAR
jgi:hypothetical protein